MRIPLKTGYLKITAKTISSHSVDTCNDATIDYHLSSAIPLPTRLARLSVLAPGSDGPAECPNSLKQFTKCSRLRLCHTELDDEQIRPEFMRCY